jgi:hypothetical protein
LATTTTHSIYTLSSSVSWLSVSSTPSLLLWITTTVSVLFFHGHNHVSYATTPIIIIYKAATAFAKTQSQNSSDTFDVQKVETIER